MQCKHADNPKALTKSKEMDVYQALQKASVDFEYQKHLPFRSCGITSETSWAYIDFTIQMSWGVVLLECDEGQHNTYDPSCDVRRDFDAVYRYVDDLNRDLGREIEDSCRRSKK